MDLICVVGHSGHKFQNLDPFSSVCWFLVVILVKILGIGSFGMPPYKIICMVRSFETFYEVQKNS